MIALICCINIVTAFAWLATALRLLSFQRHHRRYRPFVSILSWCVINGCFYCAWAFAVEGCDKLPIALSACLGSCYFLHTAIAWRGNIVKMFSFNKRHSKTLSAFSNHEKAH